MADESLDILIRTQADTSGARDAEASLGRIRDGTKEAATQAEDHNMKFREQMRLLRVLGPEFQHVGHLSHLALEGGIGIPLIAVAAGLGAVIKLTETLGEKQGELAAQALTAWRAVNTEQTEAAKKAGEYASKIDAVKGALTALKESESARMAINKAGGGGEAIEERILMSALNEAKGIAARAQARDADAQAALGAGAPGAAEAARAGAELPEAQKKSNAAFSALATVSGQGPLGKLFRVMTALTPKDEIERNIAQKRAAFEKARAHELALQGTVDQHAAAQTGIEREAAQARSGRDEATGDVRSREAALFNLHATDVTRSRAELAGLGINPESRFGGTALNFIRGQELASTGAGLDPRQTQQSTVMQRSLISQGNSQAQVLALFKVMQDLHVSHQQKIAALEAALKIQATRTKGRNLNVGE